jgi:hypothetical protein
MIFAHPCGLLNEDDAVSMIGATVKAVPINQPTYVGCNYSPSDPAQLKTSGSVIVVIFPNATASSWMRTVMLYTHQTGGQPVSSLGDAAVAGQFSATDETTVYVAVLHGSLALVVERLTFAGAPASVNTVVNLSRTILGRL